VASVNVSNVSNPVGDAALPLLARFAIGSHDAATMRGHYQRYRNLRERSANSEPNRFRIADVALSRRETQVPRALHDVQRGRLGERFPGNARRAQVVRLGYDPFQATADRRFAVRIAREGPGFDRSSGGMRADIG
jgi:hypothetical protein